MEQEKREEKPTILLTVKNNEGEIIRRIEGPAKKGFHRVSWDLRYSLKFSIDKHSKKKANEWWTPKGFLAEPGTYSVTLSKKINGVVTNLSEPQNFEVVPLQKGTLEGSSYKEALTFMNEVENLYSEIGAFEISLKHTHLKVDAMKKALALSEAVPGNLDKKIHDLKQNLFLLDEKLFGKKSKSSIGEKRKPNIYNRINAAYMGVYESTYGPTPVFINSLEIANSEFQLIKIELEDIITNRIPEIEQELKKAGAPLIR